MSELGQTTDPTALVPGEPGAVADYARRLAQRAERLAATGDGLAGTRADSWQGAAGDVFHQWLADGARRWRETADSSRRAADAIAAHGEVLAAAQRQAAEAIRIYEEGEQQTRTGTDATTDPGGTLRAQAREVLQRARQQVAESGDATSAQLIGSGPKFTGAPPADTELARIEKFIFDEMVNNSKSGTVETIKTLNIAVNPWADAPTAPVPSPAALALWTEKVRPGGDWDHKQDILTMTAGDKTNTPAPDLGGEIRYDVWSNIHYGYVGREAEFSDSALHAGANAADLAGPQHKTDPADQLAIQIGIELREQYGPDALRPEYIHAALLAHRDELLRTRAVLAG